MDTELVQKTITELLQKLHISFSGIAVSEFQGSTVFTIQTEQSNALIGVNGDTLSAFTHIVKKMVEKSLPRESRIAIDVNGYQRRKIKSLEDQARVVAERARTFKYDIELQPMSAYERMIVHSTLKTMPDIQTLSQGEGTLRHIIVRYVDPTAPKAPTDSVV